MGYYNYARPNLETFYSYIPYWFRKNQRYLYNTLQVAGIVVALLLIILFNNQFISDVDYNDKQLNWLTLESIILMMLILLINQLNTIDYVIRKELFCYLSRRR